MNSVGMLDSDIDSTYIAPEPVDEERRIRQGMRLNAKTWPTKRTWPKKTTRALPPTIIRGAALLAGGFCLGWRAFRFWRG